MFRPSQISRNNLPLWFLELHSCFVKILFLTLDLASSSSTAHKTLAYEYDSSTLLQSPYNVLNLRTLSSRVHHVMKGENSGTRFYNRLGFVVLKENIQNTISTYSDQELALINTLPTIHFLSCYRVRLQHEHNFLESQEANTATILTNIRRNVQNQVD